MTTPRPIPEPPVRLTGYGLVLREWTDEDLPAMVDLFDEAEIARWTPLPSPFDLAAAKEYLALSRESRAEGRRMQLAVTTDGGSALGEILAMAKGNDGRTVELGYAVGAPHRGHGLSTRAVRLLTAFSYELLAARRVTLRIEPHNAPSSGVARSAGFRLADEDPITIEDPAGTRITLRVWEHHRA
ncbi:GNAT family N-acetyltransferase [Streptacidiphilus sp. EB129]|uniref:GNAT family N-acetyltransferase n=1 Tax=Streptacidiphilus sp. EB129 TaxID=3156262 RepID=UPI0035189E16